MSAATFYASGKLLLSSEYFILDGAEGIAIPTVYGQRMEVTNLETHTNTLYWKAFTSTKSLWLDLVFDTRTLQSNSDCKEAQMLSLILQKIREQQSDFLMQGNDVEVATQLEFPNAWGLGSSSTLLACFAQWINIDWYALLKATIGGSGYDVACGLAKTPVLYSIEAGRPLVKAVGFQPEFSEQLYFAYLGKKQLSSQGIQHYKDKAQDKAAIAQQLTAITTAMLNSTALNAFETLLEEHELIISNALGMERVQQSMFPDYWGKVKSLGAWGGDFVLLTNNRSEKELRDYLQQKNIDVVFSFSELILKS
jgi:mevalonate kinase